MYGASNAIRVMPFYTESTWESEYATLPVYISSIHVRVRTHSVTSPNYYEYLYLFEKNAGAYTASLEVCSTPRAIKTGTKSASQSESARRWWKLLREQTVPCM